MFSPKGTNRILSKLHITNYAIVMSRTDGILIVMRHLPGYVAADLSGTVGGQKALA